MWYVRIGSRLRGPFTEDQLKLLRKRGELSSVHQVSQDQRVWEPAGTLFQQWEGKGVEPAVESPAKPAITPTTTQDAWYFSSPKGESVGPMSRQHLGQLAAAGQITSRTLIYGPGYSSWTAAGQVDFLKLSPQKKSRGLALPIALVTCLSLALVGTAGYVVYLTGGFADASGAREVGSESGEVSNVSKPDSKQTLASSNSKSRKAGSKGASADATLTEAMEERLTNATGLVYLCTRCTLGSRVIDLTPLSSGTCFVVTKEGGIVTNRHVVDIQPEIAKNPKLAEVIQAQKTDCESKGGKYSIGVYVFFGELKWELDVLHMSDRYDLAIGKIDRKRDCEYLSLSKASNLRRTDKVYTVGFPGLASEPGTSEDSALQDLLLRSKTSISEMVLPFEKEHSISEGGVERVTEFTNRVSVIQHDAKISQGNSGGPLVRSDGVVLGINTFGKKDEESLGVYFYSPEISQMRREIDEYIPGQIDWVE